MKRGAASNPEDATRTVASRPATFVVAQQSLSPLAPFHPRASTITFLFFVGHHEEGRGKLRMRVRMQRRMRAQCLFSPFVVAALQWIAAVAVSFVRVAR